MPGRKRIYVTGAGGALGAALAGHLGAVAVTRAAGEMPAAGWFDAADAGAVIVHAAGVSTAVADSDAAALARPHLELFAALAGRGWRGRAVLLSSAAVYGEADRLPVPEIAAIRPVNPYGAQKALVEAGLAALGRDAGFAVAVLRLANVYGTPRDLQRRRVIALLLDAALNGTPFTTYGDGTSLRDYLHVADLCRAVSLASAAEPAVLNLGSGTGTSLNALIAAVEAATGRRLDRRRGEVRAEAASSVLDISRAQDLLGWRPEVTLAEGLRRFLDSGAFA